MDHPAEEFREVAGTFGQRVHGVPAGGWDAPAPVEGWVARDVVRHLVEWFPGFLAGGSDVSLPPVASVDDDPAAAWDGFAASVQGVLDDPATAGRMFSNPHTELWRLLALHAAQHRNRIEHLRGRTGRNVRALSDVRADCEERGIEPALVHGLVDAP